MTHRASPVLAVLVALLPAACGDDGDPAGSGGAGGGEGATTSSTAASTSASGSTSTAAATSTSTSAGTTTAGTGGEGGGGTCGPTGVSPPTPECDACVAESCCAESAACAADDECNALALCLEACDGDTDCMVACGGEPSGLTTDLALCAGVSCFDACAFDDLQCEAFFAPGAPEPEACRACLADTCCAIFEASQTVDYYAFQQCTLGCLDAECLRACELEFPDGVEGTDVSNACLLDGCGEPCLPPDTCGFFGFGGPVECQDCIRAECCEVHADCSGSVECLDFFTCQLNCGDPESCRECLVLWGPETAALGWGMHACVQVECEACMGNACGTVPGLHAQACEACTEAACCDASAACARDRACLELSICVGLCDGDAGCEAACRDDHPEGAALFDPLDACRSDVCADDC